MGVITDKKLAPEDHIDEIVTSTYTLLANIKTAFTSIEEEMHRKIMISYIRPNHASLQMTLCWQKVKGTYRE